MTLYIFAYYKAYNNFSSSIPKILMLKHVACCIKRPCIFGSESSYLLMAGMPFYTNDVTVKILEQKLSVPEMDRDKNDKESLIKFLFDIHS